MKLQDFLKETKEALENKRDCDDILMTEEVCLEAVKQHDSTLQHMINETEEICFCEKCKKAIEYVNKQNYE